MTRLVILGLGLFGTLGWALPAMAQTTQKFQQGTNSYQGCMDTFTDITHPTDTYGGVERIDVRHWGDGTGEKMNVFIMFDVTSIPTNATVTSAKLTLYNIRARGQNGDVPVLEKVTSAWNNQLTWNSAQPTVVASGVTCPPVDGTYHDDPVLLGLNPEPYAITGMAALVQGWMASPQTNYGIKLSATSDLNFQFASSNYPLGAASSPYRPELEVIYTTPTPPNPPTATVTAPPSTATSSPITVSGTASATAPATVTQVTWLNAQSGASGTASGTTTWTTSIPLVSGSNDITITVTDSTGATGSTMFTVLYSPPPRTSKVGGGDKACGMSTVSPEGGWVLALGLLALLASLLPGLARTCPAAARRE